MNKSKYTCTYQSDACSTIVDTCSLSRKWKWTIKTKGRIC